MGNQFYRVKIDLAERNSSHTKIVDFVNVKNKVLDIGCSYGDLGNVLYRVKENILYGIEYDEDAVLHARSTGAYVQVTQGDLNTFCFRTHYRESFFDSILLADVLEHLYDPENVLKSLLPHLNDAGKIIISLPNIAHGSILGLLLLNRFDYQDCGLLDKTHIRFFTYKTIGAMLARVGLKIESADHVIKNLLGSHFSLSEFDMPRFLYSLILSNNHSFVWQYVVSAIKSNEQYMDLYRHNIKELSLFSSDTKMLIRDHDISCRESVMRKIKISIKRTLSLLCGKAYE